MRIPVRSTRFSTRPAFQSLQARLGRKAPSEAIRYLNHEVRFDTRRASDLLARSGVRCPRFEEYATPVVQFFREHEGDEAFMPAPAA